MEWEWIWKKVISRIVPHTITIQRFAFLFSSSCSLRIVRVSFFLNSPPTKNASPFLSIIKRYLHCLLMLSNSYFYYIHTEYIFLHYIILHFSFPMADVSIATRSQALRRKKNAPLTSRNKENMGAKGRGGGGKECEWILTSPSGKISGRRRGWAVRNFVTIEDRKVCVVTLCLHFESRILG